jgi:hypothetical protein
VPDDHDEGVGNGEDRLALVLLAHMARAAGVNVDISSKPGTVAQQILILAATLASPPSCKWHPRAEKFQEVRMERISGVNGRTYSRRLADGARGSLSERNICCSSAPGMTTATLMRSPVTASPR